MRYFSLRFQPFIWLKLLDVLSVFIQISKVNYNKVTSKIYLHLLEKSLEKADMLAWSDWLQVFLDRPINKFFLKVTVIDHFSVKSVLKVKTCASKPLRTELWVSPESHGNHKIKMASICCECGSLVKPLLRC